METPARADLLITDAELVATVDDARREIPGGWVAVTDGAISGIGGPGDARPDAVRTIDARGYVQVTDRSGFAEALPRLASEHGIRLYEVTPADESLESVFSYLVQR